MPGPKKKILLVNSNMETMPYPVAPLGLALIAASLENDYEVKVFDAAFSPSGEIVDVLNDFSPDAVGVGIRNIDNVTMGSYRNYLHAIRQELLVPIKAHNSVPLIIGGSAVSMAPEELLRYFTADYALAGAGEESFPRLLRDIFSNKKQLPPVIHAGINTHKELHLPDSCITKHFNVQKYLERGSYPIQSKRGCPYRCIYCSYPTIEGRTYQLRSPEEVVNEMERVNEELPGVQFEFVDAAFNAPEEHAIAICKEIISRGLKNPIRTMGINPGLISEELVKTMKEAGFSQIDCTPESASDRILQKMKKNFRLVDLIKAANILRKYDLPTMWFFMFGAPGESEESIHETFDFILNHVPKHDMVHVTEGIRIFRGTALFDTAVKEGIIPKNIPVEEKAFYVHPGIGPKNLHKLLMHYVSQQANIVHADHSKPDKKLLAQAMEERRRLQLNEPMFRTLLRIANRN